MEQSSTRDPFTGRKQPDVGFFRSLLRDFLRPTVIVDMGDGKYAGGFPAAQTREEVDASITELLTNPTADQ